MRREVRVVNAAVPTFFRALCFEVPSGGANTYALAGQELARHASVLLPEEMDVETVRGLLAEMHAAAMDARHDAILSWFDSHLPGCMELVPARHRKTFATGVIEAMAVGLIGP